MGLLKEFLRIDATRREAQEALRSEAAQRRLRISELSLEARRKRDEIGMIEEGLSRLMDDMARVEEEILGLEEKRDEFEGLAHLRKVEAVKDTLICDAREARRVVEDFRTLRSKFQSDREALLAQADSGRMMDNYFQIETFLKDNAHPIPDAARRALMKERTDLLVKIGPLVAPPPSPDSILKATVVYTGLEGETPRAIVALGLPEEEPESGAADLVSTLLFGAYASAVERLGTSAPRPKRQDIAVVFEAFSPSRAPEEAALELLLLVEDGIKKAANAAAVRCELASVFVEPKIAADIFGKS